MGAECPISLFKSSWSSRCNKATRRARRAQTRDANRTRKQPSSRDAAASVPGIRVLRPTYIPARFGYFTPSRAFPPDSFVLDRGQEKMRKKSSTPTSFRTLGAYYSLGRRAQFLSSASVKETTASRPCKNTHGQRIETIKRIHLTMRCAPRSKNGAPGGRSLLAPITPANALAGGRSIPVIPHRRES